VDAGVLRDAAQEKLPAYMVPAAFVALDELPLTPNGKVDRKALLALEATQATETQAEIVEPRTEVERGIARVWSDVLGVERVSVNTNFFDLGGHSLLLAQVRSKLKETLGANLSIIELFQYPTVSALATRVEAQGAQESTSGPADRSRSLAAGRKTLMRRRRR
jgi:acyl carrier protein